MFLLERSTSATDESPQQPPLVLIVLTWGGIRGAVEVGPFSALRVTGETVVGGTISTVGGGVYIFTLA